MPVTVGIPRGSLVTVAVLQVVLVVVRIWMMAVGHIADAVGRCLAAERSSVWADYRCRYLMAYVPAVAVVSLLLLPDARREDKHVVPGMPVPVVVTKANVPGFFTHPATQVQRDDAMEAMRVADGIVVNTFLDLEPQFLKCYEAALGKPVWALGPLCLANKDVADMASRGNKSDVKQSAAITAWLDTKGTGSVVFVSFGSVTRKLPKQLFEVGHGLEDSGEPFLWVVEELEAASPEVQEWLEALEARVTGPYSIGLRVNS